MKDIVVCFFYLSMVTLYFWGFVLLLLNNKSVLGYSIIGFLIIASIHIKIKDDQKIRICIDEFVKINIIGGIYEN